MHTNSRHGEGQNLYRRDGRERRVRRECDGATTKNQNPPRRHGEDQNQFAPRRTQRSRTTTKKILYHRGHGGTRREPKPKLTAEKFQINTTETRRKPFNR